MIKTLFAYHGFPIHEIPSLFWIVFNKN